MAATAEIVMATLTDEEKALLSPFNSMAFDLMRRDDAAAGRVPPCWLCMSDAARDEARAAGLAWLNGVVEGKGEPPMDMAGAERFAARHISAGMVAAWHRAEASRKAGREAGDPHAYFAA